MKQQRKPALNRVSPVTWHQKHGDLCAHAPRVGVKIGMGVDPIKFNRARTTIEFHNDVTFKPKRGQFNG